MHLRFEDGSRPRESRMKTRFPSGSLQVSLHFRRTWRSWLPDLVTERPAYQRGLSGVVRKEDWMLCLKAGWYEFTRYRWAV
jgi:hypothetical protein